MKLRCFSLFDITKTNVTSKKSLLGASPEEAREWQNRRNTQCNLDTIIQVISLRAQPENITEPMQDYLDDEKNENFGFLYNLDEQQTFWYFDFSVNYSSVFADGEDELGALYNDCEDVPMIKTNASPNNIPFSLDTTPELRNIYFKILSHD
jgi:hypothetical protein